MIINFADNMDAHFEPAHDVLRKCENGELYKIGNAARHYFKSLNPFYNEKVNGR